jgi:hypothetical protein
MLRPLPTQGPETDSNPSRLRLLGPPEPTRAWNGKGHYRYSGHTFSLCNQETPHLGTSALPIDRTYFNPPRPGLDPCSPTDRPGILSQGSSREGLRLILRPHRSTGHTFPAHPFIPIDRTYFLLSDHPFTPIDRTYFFPNWEFVHTDRPDILNTEVIFLFLCSVAIIDP